MKHQQQTDIYAVAGKQVCKKLWIALKNQQERLTDKQLISFLERADKTVSDVIEKWDTN